MRTLLAALLVLLGGAAAIAYMSFFIVHQNEQAIVLRFGDPRKIIKEPGLNWKVPAVETVEFFDKRILDLDSQPQEVTASDQKRLVVDSFARYKIVDPLKFYQTVLTENAFRDRFGSILNGSVRDNLGRTDLAGLYRDREALPGEAAGHGADAAALAAVRPAGKGGDDAGRSVDVAHAV